MMGKTDAPRSPETYYGMLLFVRQGDTLDRRDLLAKLVEARFVDLPFEWPEPPSQVRSSPAEPPPIARLVTRRPWLYLKLVGGEIPRPNATSS